jgi:hypothetical protein
MSGPADRWAHHDALDSPAQARLRSAVNQHHYKRGLLDIQHAQMLQKIAEVRITSFE